VSTDILYIIIGVLASAVGQIILKKGMTSVGPVTLSFNQIGSVVVRMGTNPYVVFGLFVFLGATIFWLAALSRVDLSFAYPFVSLSYVVMLVASWLFLNEDISFLRLIGTLIVIVGVLLISQS
jgi:drug/metabolite transporter (DMT)-like permease